MSPRGVAVTAMSAAAVACVATSERVLDVTGAAATREVQKSAKTRAVEQCIVVERMRRRACR